MIVSRWSSCWSSDHFPSRHRPDDLRQNLSTRQSIPRSWCEIGNFSVKYPLERCLLYSIIAHFSYLYLFCLVREFFSLYSSMYQKYSSNSLIYHSFFSSMFDSIKKQIVDNLKGKMKDLIIEANEKIQEKTPEDTFELQSKHKIQLPEMEWTHIVARVTNDDPKWKYVEYGREGRIFNYYKNSGRRRKANPFYSWVWARMYSRTKGEMEAKIKNTLKP